MDDVHAALHAAWERIRPTLERKPVELHRRLARRESALMRQHPRAWCLAIRATDTRLDRVASIHPSDMLHPSHDLTLNAAAVRFLCAPVWLDPPGQPLDEVASKLGTSIHNLLDARINGVLDVHHVDGLGGSWGKPRPLLYAPGPLDPSARLFLPPDPVWPHTARDVLARLPEGFEQTLTRVAFYKPEPRPARERDPAHADLHPEHPDLDRPPPRERNQRLPPRERDFVWYKWKGGEFVAHDWRNPHSVAAHHTRESTRERLRAYVRRRRLYHPPPARLDALEPPDVETLAGGRWYDVPAKHVTGPLWTIDPPELTELFERIRSKSIPLGQLLSERIYLGVKTGMNEAFELDALQRAALIAREGNSSELIRGFLGGQNIRRYSTEDEGRFLIAIPCGFTRREMSRGNREIDEQAGWKWLRARFRAVADHLAPFAEKARSRTDQGEFWWELRPCDYYQVLDRAKIIYPDIAKSPRFHLDTTGTWIRNTAYCLDTKDPFLLALLNSRLMWFCVARVSIPFGTRAGEYRYRMFTQYVENLPIVSARPERLVNEISRLASDAISLHAQAQSAAHPQEKEQLRRRIEATDRQIDQLVYQLYGLTGDEIRIVEEATA